MTQLSSCHTMASQYGKILFLTYCFVFNFLNFCYTCYSLNLFFAAVIIRRTLLGLSPFSCAMYL